MTEEQAKALMLLADALEACEEVALIFDCDHEGNIELVDESRSLMLISSPSFDAESIRDLNLEQYV